MSYKLFYFPVGGRGEQVRLLFHAMEQAFEDIHVKFDRFQEMRAEGVGVLPFGSLPVLHDGDLVLAQGPVIISYLARKHSFCPTDPRLAAKADSIALAAEDLRVKFFAATGKHATEEAQQDFVDNVWKKRWRGTFESLLALNDDTGYFVGDSLSHADIAVWDVVDSITRRFDQADFENAPKLQAFYEEFQKHPPIKAYLEVRTT